MNKEISTQFSKQKIRNMECVLISNDTTKLTYWRLKEPEACWEEEQKRNLSYSLSSQHSALVIDMKSEYRNKTREQLAATLLEELTQNQLIIMMLLNYREGWSVSHYSSSNEANEGSIDSERSNAL